MENDQKDLSQAVGSAANRVMNGSSRNICRKHHHGHQKDLLKAGSRPPEGPGESRVIACHQMHLPPAGSQKVTKLLPQVGSLEVTKLLQRAGSQKVTRFPPLAGSWKVTRLPPQAGSQVTRRSPQAGSLAGVGSMLTVTLKWVCSCLNDGERSICLHGSTGKCLCKISPSWASI